MGGPARGKKRWRFRFRLFLCLRFFSFVRVRFGFSFLPRSFRQPSTLLVDFRTLELSTIDFPSSPSRIRSAVRTSFLLPSLRGPPCSTDFGACPWG